MTDPAFPTRAAAQKAGWFSRRHRTDEAHREHRQLYKATRTRAARRERAELRHPPAPKIHVPPPELRVYDPAEVHPEHSEPLFPRLIADGMVEITSPEEET